MRGEYVQERLSMLRHFAIHARDGEIGRIADLFFDDHTWTARYLVVDTGSWLRHHRVLVSPIAVSAVDAPARSVTVDLTRDQIEGSPPVDTQMPLSRQMELKYRDYFSWPLYWLDRFVEAYDVSAYPRLAAADKAVHAGHAPRRETLLEAPPKGDAHLRSAARLHGYIVMATDGLVGHLDDLVLDDDTWLIRGAEIHGEDRGHKHTLFVPHDLIADMNWAASSVHLNVTRRQALALPAFEPA
jgi:PRC-barrel domain